MVETLDFCCWYPVRGSRIHLVWSKHWVFTVRTLYVTREFNWYGRNTGSSYPVRDSRIQLVWSKHWIFAASTLYVARGFTWYGRNTGSAYHVVTRGFNWYGRNTGSSYHVVTRGFNLYGRNTRFSYHVRDSRIQLVSSKHWVFAVGTLYVTFSDPHE